MKTPITQLRNQFTVWGAALAVVGLLPQLAQAQPESFSPDNSLPPPAGVYVSPQLWHVAFSNGIVIRDISHERFLDKMPPPPLGTTQTHTFGSTVRFEVSTDGGTTFNAASGSANVSVKVRHTTDVAGRGVYDTEMTQLDLTSGGLMLRESPTLPSRGKTTIRSVAGGYMIGSFFDIFTELSTDGGATWLPAVQAGHVELRKDPNSAGAIPTPSDLLPPPNDVYVSPADWHAAYAAGIVIKDVRHEFFVGSHPPPASGAITENFDSQLDLQLSTDGGATFRALRAPASVQVQVTRRSTAGLFDTEMMMLNFSLPGAAGGMPIMIRESPTEPSRGQTQITPQADGTFRIGSFFDIFTELSLDGGATWMPSTTGPVRVQLVQGAPEQPAPTPDLPPSNGEYISPDKWHALYASGIIISNVSHSRFQPSTPPPPPGGTQVHTFNSSVSMDVLQPGLPPQHVVAPAMVSVRVTSMMDSGGTRYFETEMLQLDIQGGGLPPVMRVRESPTKASLGRTSIRKEPAGGQYLISSFFDIFTELSLDGGQTWSPAVSGPASVRLRTPITTPINITCPVNLTVPAAGAAGAVVTYVVPAGGGCGGPVTVTCTPASGSLFPIGSTTVTCVATDPCGNAATCTFQVIVTPTTSVAPEIFFKNPLLPPPPGVYISPAQWHILFANGIVIRDVRHRRFTQGFEPPPVGGTTVHSFGSQVDFEFSTSGPAGPFQPGSAPANVTVRVTHTQDAGGKSFFDTEMLALDLGGSSALRLRESPTLPSRGQTTMRATPGGSMISSFFDIWTELSVDGGQTWMPAQGAGHVELRADVAAVEPVGAPTAVLPPPTQFFTSVQGPYQLAGVMIRNINNRLFSASQLPPPAGASQTQSFNSQVDMELSTDGGNTFQAVRAPATQQVRIASLSAGDEQMYDMEMLSLNIGGGGLPTGMRLRESPTEPSRGMTELTMLADGSVRIGSFFDIFTEISLDNGNTWSPLGPGPVRMELKPQAPEQPEPNPNLPPVEDEYISPDRWHALFANGIIITNVSHQRFTQNQPPPPVGVTQTHNFGSMVAMDLILGPGLPPQHVLVPATVSVQVTGKLDSNGTRYFDTEMLSLNLEGLPGGMMVRESPTKASLGRTSIRQVGTQFRIGSFFDIFTELSMNGGQTWLPSLGGPGTVSLHKPVPVPVAIACPADMVVSATSAAGAVVNYTVAANGGCDPAPTVTCTPPSGSVFPIGTTTVICVAKDSCGNIARCTFNVTVRRYVKPRLFPTNLLPPPTGQYVSPDRWHALYANGIIISNASHNRFTASLPPPPPGVPQIHAFGSQVKFDISNDGGKTFHPMVATADVQIMLMNIGDPTGNEQVFQTEMLGLNMFAGPSAGVMIRESPTRASTGEVRIMPASGGFMISSFFDIWTELSLDGGQTWSPSEIPAELELQVDPGAGPPEVTNVRLVNGRPTFTMPTRLGLTYLTEFTESLTNPFWQTINGALGSGTPMTQTDYQSGGSKQRFYRTRIEETLTE